jgi:hypothetical protein
VLAPGDLIVAVKLLQHVGAGVELVEREHVVQFERVQAAGRRLNARAGHRAGRPFIDKHGNGAGAMRALNKAMDELNAQASQFRS